MISIQEAIAPYEVGSTGIIGLKPNNTGFEDNCHLFTATYHNLLRLRGENDEVRADRFFGWITRCRQRISIFNRRPDFRERLVSHDEYIGICNFADYIASEICDYNQNWYFNNTPVYQGLSAWHYRMLIAVPYYKLRAKRPVSALDSSLWCASVLYTCYQDTGNTSGRCLIFLQREEILKSGSVAMKKAMRIFLDDCSKRYGDLAGLYRIYFGDHPFTTYAASIKF